MVLVIVLKVEECEFIEIIASSTSLVHHHIDISLLKSHMVHSRLY